MLLSNIPLLGMVKERMEWSAQRHRVLAQNIANANTPAYRSRDLKPLDFSQTLRHTEDRLRLARTSERHFDIADTANSYRVVSDAQPYEISPDGNTVALEDQVVKMTQNATDQRLAATVHRKMVALYRVALGRGN